MLRRLLPAVALATVALLTIASADQGRLRGRASTVGGGGEPSGNLLTTADLECEGLFLSPYVDGDGPGGGEHGRSGGFPLAMRYVDDERVWYIYDAKGHIIEFPEPTLSPCETAFVDITPPSILLGQDWGQFNVHTGIQSGGSSEYTPGLHAVYAYGLKWDEENDYLILNWTNTYADTDLGANSFAAATFDTMNDDLDIAGCWALTNTAQPIAGTGTLVIPSGFAGTYLSGKRWAIGFGGGVASLSSGPSLGPTLTAIGVPSGNACAADTNTAVGAGTILSRYMTNTVGPTCVNAVSGEGLGCTPSQAPTTPYMAHTSHNAYSVDQYSADWDPYDGHGWFVSQAIPKIEWYKDASKEGVLSVFVMPEGWMKTTVEASPTPTYSAGSGTFSVASTSTHFGGRHLQVGNIIGVQTCTPGVDSGCTTVNDQHISVARVTSVNTGTGAIGFTVTSGDSAGVDDLPVAGGSVYMGVFYAHGGTHVGRYTPRLQIYDPARLAEVAQGSRLAYNVTYAEEISLIDLLPDFGFGYPGGSTPGMSSEVGGIPTALVADPTAHQIIACFQHARTLGTINSSACYVFNVDQP